MDTSPKATTGAGFKGTEKRTTVTQTDVRLMGVTEAGLYVGCSCWTIRDWIKDGILWPVRLPGSRIKDRHGRVLCHSTERSVRKVLIDRQDLDRLIEESKT